MRPEEGEGWGGGHVTKKKSKILNVFKILDVFFTSPPQSFFTSSIGIVSGVHSWLKIQLTGRFNGANENELLDVHDNGTGKNLCHQIFAGVWRAEKEQRLDLYQW